MLEAVNEAVNAVTEWLKREHLFGERDPTMGMIVIFGSS
jgi:hypothetical protein